MALVQFIQEDRVNGFSSVIAEVVTSGGVAQIDYLLEELEPVNRCSRF